MYLKDSKYPYDLLDKSFFAELPDIKKSNIFLKELFSGNKSLGTKGTTLD